MNNELTTLNAPIVETTDQDYKRIQKFPGIGFIITAETIAAIDKGKQFKNGRQFATWLGLTPRHSSSGENRYMGKISKRGNNRLRTLQIHGARTVMNWVADKTDKLSCWVKNSLTHNSPKIVTVAPVNKLARILWSVVTQDVNYQPND